MTESVCAMDESAVRAAMQAELDGVDAIARYRFDDDFNIAKYTNVQSTGPLASESTIDSIPNVSPVLTDSLRKVAYAFDEPDTRDEAFLSAPSLSFPESQERYKALQVRESYNEYLQFASSQSQQMGTQASSQAPSQAPSQTGSTPSALRAPPSAQVPRLEVPRSDRGATSPRRSAHDAESASPRRSPRGMVPSRRLSGYAVGDEGNADRSARRTSEAGPSIQQRLSDRVFSSTKTLQISSSSSSDSEESEGPRPGTKRGSRRSSDATDQGSSAKRARANPPAPASRDERRQHAAAAKVTPATHKADPPHPSREIITVEDDDHARPLRIFDGKNAHKRFMEGDIAISAAAKNSILGASQDSDAYAGCKYLSSEWTDATKTIVKEKWWCLVCKEPKTASKAGKPTNLRIHRKLCPIPEGGIPDDLSVEETGATKTGANPRSFKMKGKSASSAASTTLGPSTYHGASLHGWLNGQQPMHVKLTRRLGLIAVIKNALPFQHLSSPAVRAMIKSIDAKATLALTTGATVRRDLAVYHRNLESDMKGRLSGIDTLFSVQHDAWTTKAFQFSFVAMLASYVDQNWEFRETLLSFDVLKAKHTGATFSGHLTRTLLSFNLGEKWAGTVTSDSTGTNHRMMDMLEQAPEIDKLQPKGRGKAAIDRISAAQMKSSPSAFPYASMRHTYRWTGDENKILCMNHHINLAVRAGFASLGVTIKASSQRKVLNLQPIPAIVVQDEKGNSVEVDFERWLPADTQPPAAPPRSAASRTPAPTRKGKERAIEATLEDDDTVDAGVSSSAGAVVDGTDSQAPAEEKDADDEEEEEEGEYLDDGDSVESSSDEEDMGPEVDEILSDDGGGPEVNGPTKTRTSRTQINAISKLEAFTTSIHRGSGRRDNFRTRMAKEFHMDPKLANAPFPPKPNATRWNSHFAMIKAALKIREAIDAHCRAHIGVRNEKLGSYLLTESEWTMLEFLIPILKLAAEATKELEKARGTLYMVLDHHASLRDKIKATFEELETADLGQDTTASLKSFLTAMDLKLKKYRNLALQNRYTLAAALLDPANRMDLFELAYPSYVEDAEKALRDLMKEWLGAQSGDQRRGMTATSQTGGSASTTMLQQAKILRLQQVAAARRKKDDAESDEVARYLNTKNCPWRDSDETPCKWWRDNEGVFPSLAKLARVVLGIPGSSSSVERVFSQASLFSTSKRQSLSSKALSELVSAKHWLIHGADELSGLSDEVRQVADSIKKLPEL